MADLDHMDEIAAYRVAMIRVNAAMPTEQLARLRDLRLWAWRQVLTHRKCADDASKANLSAISSFHHRCADNALGHVQTLNDFFSDIGDTAERDHESRA
jgi:hypothetical protein